MKFSPQAKLEAFSPFIRLNTDDSSLPVTVMQFTLQNLTGEPVTATLSGELENGICLHHRNDNGLLCSTHHAQSGQTQLLYSAEAALEIGTYNQRRLESLSDFGTISLALITL